MLLIKMQSEGVHHKLTEVPHQIHRDDAKPNMHRRTQSVPANINQSEISQGLMPLMPMYGGYYSHHPHFPPYGPPPYQHTYPPYNEGARRTQRELDIPSSDGFEPEDEPTLYPRTNEWLATLDAGARGSDGQNWQQYSSVLTTNGYIRVSQIASEGKSEEGAKGAKELVDICWGMSLGTAKLLIKYATIDCERITKKETKQRRVERNA